jgi:DNA replicative helicase MCM subunit Mcm2 (Cdc46/Mcm family)
MELHKFLTVNSEEILSTACASLSRAKIKHYHCSEESENRKRLKNLLDLTIECITTKKLNSMIRYMEEMAKERYYAGFDFSEVHAAINVLEETIWIKINNSLKPEELGEALGLVSTVLGAAKENLARTYISLSSKTKAPSLDLTAIFGRN